MARVDDMSHKIMSRFDASDEHNKVLRSDLASIGKKVDIHAISIKQLELQMSQLSATVNTDTLKLTSQMRSKAVASSK